MSCVMRINVLGTLKEVKLRKYCFYATHLCSRGLTSARRSRRYVFLFTLCQQNDGQCKISESNSLTSASKVQARSAEATLISYFPKSKIEVWDMPERSWEIDNCLPQT